MVEYIEEITVCNEQIFNDKESHTITMRFYDGYAISTNNLYGMSYPTLFQVQNTDWMQKEITDYCGDGRDGTDYPFDIALKYGVLFKLPQDSKLERKIKWLEQFAIVDVNRKAAYEKFCNELDAPNKEYFVLYHDRTGDGGMSVKYIGECCCDDEAIDKAFSIKAIPQDTVHFYRAEDIEASNMAVDYGKDMEVVAVYHSSSQYLEEYWTVVSVPVSCDKFAAFVWNRGDKSKYVSNRFYTFPSYIAMQEFVQQEKVNEMQDDLPEFNISWFLENLKGDTGLKPDETLHNINIWAQEGYNVWIVCGTYK